MATDPQHRSRQSQAASGSENRPETLGALLALLALDDLPRTGWILRGIGRPESVAGHIVGVAYVALALAPRVDPPLDMGRTLAMALVHDAPEARTGDLPSPAGRHLPAGAKAQMEAGVAADVVDPLSGAAAEAFAEYRAQDTREARFVHACDRLQMGVRLLGYEQSGRAGLAEFWDSLPCPDIAEFPPCAELLEQLQSQRGACA